MPLWRGAKKNAACFGDDSEALRVEKFDKTIDRTKDSQSDVAMLRGAGNEELPITKKF